MKILLSTVILLSAGLIARAQLVGLDFNSGSGNWEYRTVNAATGATTSLNTFPLSAGLTDGAFVTDSSGGSAYIISGSGLYHLSLGTGSVLGTSSLDTSITLYGLSSSGLAGVAFNSGTGNWEYRSINSVSGVTTLLNTFTLANGLNDSSFVTDPSGGSAYLISGTQFYHLSLSTGAVLGTASLDTGIVAYGRTASGLAGIDFNSGTGNWEYRTINAASGATTLLNTFALPNGYGSGSFVTDPSTDSAYLLSGSELYDLNLNTGAVVSTASLDTPLDTIGLDVVPEPSTALLTGMGILAIALHRFRMGRKAA